jgi:hypothetical protein
MIPSSWRHQAAVGRRPVAMMKRIPSILLLSLTLGVPASACLNKYDRSAAPERPAEYIARLTPHPEHDRMMKEPAPPEPGPGAGYRARNDYAAVLVHRGEARKAVGILEAVEAEHPGEYVVAGNLGTAYELSGDLEQAHRWISEGIRRNPNAHEGTEWLHLRILEARQAVAKDPAWLKAHSVLGMSFGAGDAPAVPATLPKGAANTEDVIKALTYQLHERMAFVPAPDPMVGGMLADLGDLLSLSRSVDVAIPVYGLALNYGPPHSGVIGRRLEVSKELVKNLRHSETPVGLILGGVAIALLGGAGLLTWLQRSAAATLQRPRRRV